MKKLLGFIALLLVLTGCGAAETAEPGETEPSEAETLNVYTTVYPLTYFTERIGKDRVDTQSIYPAGANEHTFEPTQQDMIALAEADAVFYIGLGLEGFIDSAKETLASEDVTFAATAESIPEQELAQGDAHAHETEEEHAEHAHEEVDPHVWISPVLSQYLAESIKNQLIELDPEGAELYEANYEELVAELDELDASFQDIAANAARDTFFVSHAAFGYLADAYGLEQVAIAGLNSQSEPSQQELAEIVDRAKELDIQHIIFEQNVSSDLTEIVQNEIGAEAVQLHNLSILTEEDVAAGKDYFSLMEQNRETLQNVLN